MTCGQGGVQLGDQVWREYYAERGVLADGTNADTSDDGLFCCFNDGLLVDLEANGSLLKLFNAEFLLNGKGDVGGGNYTISYIIGNTLVIRWCRSVINVNVR